MIVDEIRQEVMSSLQAFDFASAFPAAYAGTKAVTIVPGWPFDLLDNMLAENDGQMTMPVLSVTEVDASDTYRSLGDITNVGAPAGLTRHATRINASFLVSSWADQRLGGADTVRLLGDLVMGWAFLNRSQLAAFRQLHCSASHGAVEERPQMWRHGVTVAGYAVLSYDA